MHGSHEIVLAVVEYVVVYRHAGGDKLSDAALHELLGELRILELLADSHALSGAHEFGEVGVERMVGESGKLNVGCVAVGTLGESDSKYFRCRDGIFGECLVEVANTEKQHGVGMFLFHLGILLHERCLNYFLRHLDM